MNTAFVNPRPMLWRKPLRRLGRFSGQFYRFFYPISRICRRLAAYRMDLTAPGAAPGQMITMGPCFS